MVPLALASRAGVCVMHMQGTPATMQDAPSYHDVVEEVYDYLRRRRDGLVNAGLDVSRICLDPGIGFGKTHQHNLELLRHCDRLLSLGCPLLVGPSRKGFISHVLGEKRTGRMAGTIGVALCWPPKVSTSCASTTCARQTGLAAVRSHRRPRE